MILKALTLENFKGIREPVRIEFAPLTLLFGPNSSGKSTIFKALQFTSALLKAAGGDPFDVSAADGVDLGDFRDVVNDHDTNKVIRLGYEILMPAVFPNYDPSGIFHNGGSDNLDELEYLDGPIGGHLGNATVTLEVRYNPEIGRAYLAKYQVDVKGIPFGTIHYDTELNQATIIFVNFCHPVLIEADPQYLFSYESWLKDAGLSRDEDLSYIWGDNSNTKLEYYIRRHNKHPYGEKPYPIAIKNYKGSLGNVHGALQLDLDKIEANNPEGVTYDYQAACCILSDGLLGPAWQLAVILDSAVFLGPLRHIPSRDQAEFSGIVKPNLATGEAAWHQIIHSSHEFIAKVNSWLSDSDKLATDYGIEVFRYREVPVIESTTVLSDQLDGRERSVEKASLHHIPIRKRVVLKDERRGLDLTLRDVGVGLSQLLPILVESLRDTRGFGHSDLLGIEQPELHLHPALQVRLADLFISASNRNTNRRQFLVETHSEHLMLRCLRRIRETGDGELTEGRNNLDCDNIAVLFVEPSEAGPRIHRIRIDEAGEFMDPWPIGFFPERMKEICGDDL